MNNHTAITFKIDSMPSDCAPPFQKIATPRSDKHAASHTSSDSCLTVDMTQTHNESRRNRLRSLKTFVRSSTMTRMLRRFSSCLAQPKVGDPSKKSSGVSRSIHCDCQQHFINVSDDSNDEATLHGASLDPLASLTLLREALGSMAKDDGCIDRAKFTQAFDLSDTDFDGYDNENGTIDGKAIVIDAVTELDVDAEEKLRFIFDTVDTNRVGSITIDQVVRLLDTNFSDAKLELLGTDSKAAAELMFRKANVHDSSMDYSQFRSVFHLYVASSFGVGASTENNDSTGSHLQHTRRKFGAWYDANKLRIWWLTIYVIANAITIYHKWFRYNIDPAIGYGLRIARCGSQVAMFNSLFVLMPMLRSVTQVLKRYEFLWRVFPFDDHIIAHKIIGSVLLSAGLVHTGAHISNQFMLYFVATPEMVADSIFVARKAKAFEHGLPPFMTMLQVIPVWTGVIMVLITFVSFPLAAIPKFRQRNFNLFWYSHMLLGLYFVMLCIHGTTSWLERATSYMWAAPPFALYLLERRFRYAKMFTSPVRILEVVELDETLAVVMEKPRRFVIRPGMYLLINCPTISNHEWHPFTISSAPGDNYVSIHIRKAGVWTSAFHKLIALRHANGEDYPEVYLDGPSGSPTQGYNRYSTIICVAAGIGVTPFVSILKDVVHLWEQHGCQVCKRVRHSSSFPIQKLYFHWTTRAQGSLSWFENTMNQITSMDQANIIQAHQYLTSVQEGEAACQLKMIQQFVHEETGRDVVSGLQSKTLTHFGRPDWNQVFINAKRSHPNEKVGVFYCGPHALEDVLAAMCKKHSDNTPGGTVFAYHSEKFT